MEWCDWQSQLLVSHTASLINHASDSVKTVAQAGSLRNQSPSIPAM
jgi:hypothetical protein